MERVLEGSKTKKHKKVSKRKKMSEGGHKNYDRQKDKDLQTVKGGVGSVSLPLNDLREILVNPHMKSN